MSITIPLYQVDAFATEVFRGNPAAVCPLDAWLGEDVMQAIAAENNLSETAFVVADPSGEADYGLRWFTPKAEIELCGHATLATAWVLFNALSVDKDVVTFSTQSGILSVERCADGELVMDFPLIKTMPAPHPDDLSRALHGAKALEYLRAKNDMRVAVLGSAQEVRDLKPDFHTVYTLGQLGLIVTAPGGGGEDADVDFVSRFFAPQVGISEDPVTGSAHTVLAPYWARRLKKDTLRARQVSSRGGDVGCEIVGPRVRLSGRAVLYMKGEIRL
ncbi:PhzF family phenazine biosynthesis protein [Pseudomonadota bacterium]